MNSLLPDWPAPMNIKVLFSDRRGGFSNTPYASLNLGVHVGDDAHLQSLGNPLIGDPTYGGHYRRPRSGDEWLSDALRDFKRQALHAKKLALQHPATGKKMTWTVNPPEDFTELLDLLYG